MPNVPESTAAAKHSSGSALFVVSFDAASPNRLINYSHTVRAYDDAHALGLAVMDCRRRYIGSSVDLESIIINRI